MHWFCSRAIVRAIIVSAMIDLLGRGPLVCDEIRFQETWAEAVKGLSPGLPRDRRRGRTERNCLLLSLKGMLMLDGKHAYCAGGSWSTKASISLPSQGLPHQCLLFIDCIPWAHRMGPSRISCFLLPEALLFLPCPLPVFPVALALRSRWHCSHVVSGSQHTAQPFLYFPKLFIVCGVTDAVSSGN